MYKTLSLLAFVFSCVVLSGCATLQEMLTKPTVSFERVRLENMSLLQGTAVFTYAIENPYPVPLQLKNLQYKLRVNGKEITAGAVEKGLSLNPNSTQSVDLPLTVEFADFFSSLAEFMEKDSIPYELSGSFGFGLVTIPFQKAGTFSIPKLPEISIKNIEIQNMSFLGATLLLTLDIQNENSFALAIDGLDYHITLGALNLVSGKTVKKTELSDQGKATVTLPVKVNFLSLGQAAYQLFSQPTTEYAIQGNMNFTAPEVGEKSFPFSKNGSLRISK